MLSITTLMPCFMSTGRTQTVFWTLLQQSKTENFDEVFGTNTDYVIDPEECLADNFSFAMVYGIAGPDGNGYPAPHIIEAILAYLCKADLPSL